MQGVTPTTTTNASSPPILPYPIGYHHQGMYFNRAAIPTFGEPSLAAPGSFASMRVGTAGTSAGVGVGTGVGGVRGGYSVGAGGHGVGGQHGTVVGRAISVSSDSSVSGESPLMGERMVGVRGPLGVNPNPNVGGGSGGSGRGGMQSRNMHG
jgi:hypothetical protein